jgi:hypothetical protein
MILHRNTNPQDNLVAEIGYDSFQFRLDLVDQSLVSSQLDGVGRRIP